MGSQGMPEETIWSLTARGSLAPDFLSGFTPLAYYPSWAQPARQQVDLDSELHSPSLLPVAGTTYKAAGGFEFRVFLLLAFIL